MAVFLAALLALVSGGTHKDATIRPCRIAGQEAGPSLEMTVGAVRIGGRTKIRSAQSIAAIALKSDPNSFIGWYVTDDGADAWVMLRMGKVDPGLRALLGDGFAKANRYFVPLDKRTQFPESLILEACDASSKEPVLRR